jgi:hypothetical protein
MRRCIGEPVSWLRLERYELGELPASDARAVATHLAECAVCRACFVHITADARGAIELGPDLEPPQRVAPPPSAAKRRSRLAAWLGGGALASAALAAWLMVSQRAAAPHGSPSVKGGELALELVRVDGAGRQLEATHFAPDDRWKALVSCAPGAEGRVAVLVFQDGETSLPLPPQPLESCGNRRPLAGAFRLRGGPAQVCVVRSEAPTSQLMAATSPDALPGSHACLQLTPVSADPR